MQRTNLAQELHDGIAQDLVGLGYSLDLLLAAPNTPAQTRIDIRSLRFTLTDILEKVRSEIHQLRSSSADTLAQSIRRSAENICVQFSWDFQIKEVPIAAESDIGYEILQIAREVLRNIATHSGGTVVNIKMWASTESVHLEISDDGKGGAQESPTRYGIVGARTRAANLGASLEIQSTGSGTRVYLCVPIESA